MAADATAKAAASEAESAPARVDGRDSDEGLGDLNSALRYRSDSIKRCYEVQHRFVLAQLTAPGVEAFLASDDDDSDVDGDEGSASGRLSRGVSRFV